MSFQGTRTKHGSVDVDRSAVGRGVVIQLLCGLVVFPAGLLVEVQPGYLLIPTTLLAGGYVGLRTENWGDEYMDGAAMGVVGGLVAGLVAGVGIGLLAVVTGESATTAFLGFAATTGLIVLLMVPILGIFGALAAWAAATYVREPA